MADGNGRSRRARSQPLRGGACRASLVHRLSPARQGRAKRLRLVASMKGPMLMRERRRADCHLAFLICSGSLAPHPIKGHSPQAVRRNSSALSASGLAALKRDL